MSSQPPASRSWHDPCFREKSAKRGSGGKGAAQLCAGCGRVLSVDECAQRPELLRIFSKTLECGNRERIARSVSAAGKSEGGRALERTENAIGADRCDLSGAAFAGAR